MKNAVRFLFLFGAGLVLILVLDWKQSDELLGVGGSLQRSSQKAAEQSRQEGAGRGGASVPVRAGTGTGSGAAAGGDVQPEAGSPEKVRIVLDGELDYTRYGARRTPGPANSNEATDPARAARPIVYHVLARDVDHLTGDTYRLHDVEVEVYDEESSGVRLQVVAEEGLVEITDEAHSGAHGDSAIYSIGEGGAVVLDRATATWRGDVLAPTTLRARHMEGDPSGGEWIASGAVNLTAPGLEALGEGLVISPEEGRAVFGADGELLMEGGARRRARMTSNGPLVLVRQLPGPGQQGGRFTVDGSEGCRLVLDGGARLDAEAVHLEGSQRPTGNPADGPEEEKSEAEAELQNALGLTAARASGSVTLRRGGDLFSGERADIVMFAGGQPRQAELRAARTGKVTGRIPLAGSPTGDVEEQSADTPVTGRMLVLSGEGPLTVSFASPAAGADGEQDSAAGPGPGTERDEAAGFSLQGPAVLLIAPQGSGAPEAGGGEPGNRDSGALRAEGLVAGRREANGVLHLVTEGETHLSGRASDGEHFTLHAARGLETAGTNGSFSLRRAGGATLQLQGAEELAVRAQELRDLDSVAGTFTATGDVELTGADWKVTAEHVERRGPEELSMTGTAAAPAHYTSTAQRVVPELSLREVRGLNIELVGDEARARGAVSAVLWEPATRSLIEIDGGLTGRLVVHPDGTGFLESDGEPVEASGALGASGIPWSVTGSRIVFGGEFLEVLDADLTWDRNGNGVSGAGGLPQRTPLRARARRLQASGERLLLNGSAEISGVLADGSAWDLSAGRLRLLPHDPDLPHAPPLPFEPRLRQLVASGGYSLSLGQRLSANGATLDLTGKGLSTAGGSARDPARITVQVAAQEAGRQLCLETARLDLDFSTWLPSMPFGGVTSGTVDEGGWILEFASLGPVEGAGASGAEGEETILALSEAVHRSGHRSGQRAILGSWLLAWLDGPSWRARGRMLFGLEETRVAGGIRGSAREAAARRTAQGGGRGSLLGGLELASTAGLVESVYAEGELEILEGQVRRARARRMFLDLRHGGGWLDDADLILDVEVRDKPERLRAQARHMVHSADGSLHADNATITSCGQDKPHYVVETGDLTVTPAGGSRPARPGQAALPSNASWAVAARNNVLRLPVGPALPLPPLVYATDEEGNPIIENIVLSNSARFGTALGATVNREAGNLARGLAGMLGAPMENLDGSWRYRASYLGARGLLLGLGLRLKAPESFALTIDGDGIFDGHGDRGLVRVEEDERDDFRGWMRGRGRWTLGAAAWVDLVFSKQSDPGVQAEFFESDYLTFEERETYLHGRWSEGNLFGSARVRMAADNWRSAVEELPAAGLSMAPRPLASWDVGQLLWSAEFDAGLFRRRQGDERYELLFDDGALVVDGEPRVARFDHGQRLELPMELGWAGLKLTPHVAGRVSAWDRGVEENDGPLRLMTAGGARLSTTFSRRAASGALHQLSPSLGLGHTFSWDESGGQPVPMDALEDDPRGTALEFSLVTRFFKPGQSERFDLDLRAGFGEQVPRAARRWLPISTLAEWRGEVYGTPVGLVHDSIYDGEEGRTDYSRTELGLRLVNGLGLELGYRSARDEGSARFYEAATAAARYRATPLWEVEFRETFSLIDDAALHEKLTLRRLGHDFLFEIGIGNRRGEGGATLSFTVEPLLGWRRRSLGLLDRWRLGSW